MLKSSLIKVSFSIFQLEHLLGKINSSTFTFFLNELENVLMIEWQKVSIEKCLTKKVHFFLKVEPMSLQFTHTNTHRKTAKGEQEMAGGLKEKREIKK